MKILRTLVTALAAVIVAGTVASAAPPLLSSAPDAEPTPEVAVTPSQTPSPESTDPLESEPTETPSPSPSASETSSPPGSDEEGDGASAAPDFSACEGLTGLENAICRHEALLAVDPENEGLQNALQRLLDNQARHDGAEEPVEEPAPEEPAPEEPAAETSTPCPGKSCEDHGNGHDPH
jgi:ABC-type transport system substrate-binding protein